MKKVIASASLVAVGALSLQAANAPGLTRMETAKPWSISASLRGFYDSNPTTAPKGLRDDSFGFEVSPSASINIPLDQTFIGASYTYSMRYYENRSQNRADHSHLFTAKLDHAFSPNHKLELNNSFTIAHEPELQTGAAALFPLRTEGSYIRNRASAFFNAQLSELFGVRVGYQNSLYDYDQSGVGSRSARLDRMEHLGTLDLRWQLAPPTVAVFGYQYGVTDYTSNDALFPGVSSSVRDNRTHYFYGGLDQRFNEQLNGSFRLGATHTDYRSGGDEWSPYADATLSYQYGPGSYLQTGIRHERIATDIIGPTAATVVLDQEATSLWASVTHQITAKLTGGLLGQFQHSEINGGGPGLDGETERFFIAGLNLTYRFTQHLSAEAGYNYDRLNSELARSYTRNRAYVGVRATF